MKEQTRTPCISLCIQYRRFHLREEIFLTATWRTSLIFTIVGTTYEDENGAILHPTAILDTYLDGVSHMVTYDSFVQCAIQIEIEFHIDNNDIEIFLKQFDSQISSTQLHAILC